MASVAATALLGFQSLKAARELLQGLHSALTASEVLDVKLNLGGLLVDAQEAHLSTQQALSTAAERDRGLEKKIMELENWSAEAARYHLSEIGNGCLAYSPDFEESSRDALHFLCANCFQKREKSILQPEQRERGEVVRWRCHPCGQTLYTDGEWPAADR